MAAEDSFPRMISLPPEQSLDSYHRESILPTRLQAAKRAAQQLAGGLTDNDRLSVVSFANEPVSHVVSVLMTGDTRSAVCESIQEIHTRGRTDLHAGWETGLQLVEAGMNDNQQALNRVVLLSDGHANLGIMDPDQLADIAQRYREAGISTSAVGIGNGYSTTQLAAITTASGGELHDAEFCDEIGEIVLGELREILSTALENVELSITIPPGVRVSALGYPGTLKDDTCVVPVGSLIHGAVRHVVLALDIPAGASGEVVNLQVTGRWNDVQQEGISIQQEVGVQLDRVSAEDAAACRPNIETAERVAVAWSSVVFRTALNLNRQRQYKEAERYVREQLAAFSDYCADLPRSQVLVREMERLEFIISRSLDERLRKNLSVSKLKAVKGTSDFRSRRRQSTDQVLRDWTERNPDS
jgi:Ca-activated chloride channel family protein